MLLIIIYHVHHALNCSFIKLLYIISLYIYISIFKFGYFIKKEKRKIKRYNIMQLVKQKSNTQNGIK